jgi:tetratricopeptide (TPR) repeat protein
MTLKEINQLYNRIAGSLDNREVKDAFDLIQSLISGSREYSFQDKLDEIQETYKRMLHYRMDGVKDPMLEDIYHNILASAYELADRIRLCLLTPASPQSFYTRRRTPPASPETAPEDVYEQLAACYETGNTAGYEEMTRTLFNRIWTEGFLAPAGAAALRRIWNGRNLPFVVQCQAASALTLGLLEFFDKEKLLLLFDAAQVSGSEEVRIRAIIGILLTLYIYRRRTALYPRIAARLSILAEEPGFARTVQAVIPRFILSRETEKINRRLQDEILPELIKLNSGINPDDPADAPAGTNPEWQDILPGTPLEKTLEEIIGLQQEGADLMLSTFLPLKNFPFFRETSHWFLPFTTEHSLCENLPPNEADILGKISAIPFLCNSDKYSLCLSMKQMPGEARRVMLEQFGSHLGEGAEQYKSEWTDSVKTTGIIISQYIQDLYRFFKLYPAHTDFEDIFIWPLDFHNLPLLKPYLCDRENLARIADYYMQRNYFDDALPVYLHLAKSQKDDHILFQKIGYCRQMNGDIPGALEAYLHAGLLDTESKWLLRRIAGCYRSLKQPAEALACYRRYEELSPGYLPVQMSIGHCYLELKDYNEALKYFFKVDYLDAGSHKAWRPIAWCSFLTGRYDQARNYYRKIIREDNPGMHDLLNAGHTEWALQNNRKAINFYLQAIDSGGRNFRKFREQFLRDAPGLIVAGIQDTEVPSMLDHLMYLLA